MIFVLPTELPVTRGTFNWAPVAVGIVLVATLVSWYLPCGVGARHWFRGEKGTLLDAWVRAHPTLVHPLAQRRTLVRRAPLAAALQRA